MLRVRPVILRAFAITLPAMLIGLSVATRLELVALSLP